LGRVQVGQFHIQAQTAHPQRVHPRYLGDITVLPSLTAWVTAKLMAEAPQNGAAAVVDQEITERQQALVLSLLPLPRRVRRTRATRRGTTAPAVPHQPVPEDDPNDEAAWEALRRHSEGGT
jgi:hypothetical protein